MGGWADLFLAAALTLSACVWAIMAGGRISLTLLPGWLRHEALLCAYLATLTVPHKHNQHGIA